jgi:hypothetical protein
MPTFWNVTSVPMICGWDFCCHHWSSTFLHIVPSSEVGIVSLEEYDKENV